MLKFSHVCLVYDGTHLFVVSWKAQSRHNPSRLHFPVTTGGDQFVTI